MNQRINVLTIGVNDLQRSMAFFRDLGWQTKGIVGTEFENGAAVFFELSNGLRLSLYERSNLAWDSRVKAGPPSATEFSIGYFVNSPAEVDSVLRLAEQAGATIAKPAQKTFWGGYGGYFQDPDGHLWEIAHYPPWKVAD